MFDPFQPISPTLWMYLSGVAVVAVFFRFRRAVSIRNGDLVALFCLAPGLVMIEGGRPADGFFVVFLATGYFLFRCLMDLALERRPACEPNLSNGGLLFLTLALATFQVGRTFAQPADPAARQGAAGAGHLLQHRQMVYDADGPADGRRLGPGYYLWHVPGWVLAQQVGPGGDTGTGPRPTAGRPEELAAQATAALTYLMALAGLLTAGARWLGGGRAGLSLAALYALMPYTMRSAHLTHHVLPGALAVWAVALADVPIVCGALLGLATSVTWYAVLLVPLWLGYVRPRGRDLLALTAGLVAALVLTLLPTLLSGGSLRRLLSQTLVDLEPFVLGQWSGTVASGTLSFWHYHLSPSLRMPVLVALGLCALGLYFWPSRKTVAHVAALSAAVLLGVQFWLPEGGGLHVLWYLPVLLVTLMRTGMGPAPAG